MTTLYSRNIKLVIHATKSIVVEDLYVSFEVLLRNSEKINTGKFMIYNLAKSTRSLIQGDYIFCEFFTSYGSDEPSRIFQGEIMNVFHNEVGADWVTELYAGDGIKSIDTSYFNKTFKSGVAVRSIIDEIASSMGLSLRLSNSATTVLNSVVLKKSRTLEGNSKKAINDFLKDFGLDWSVQFGVLEIALSGEEIVGKNTIVNINSESGLIGSPAVNWKKVKKGKVEKFESSVSFESLIIPELVPNSLINVQSDNFKVNFSDLYGNKLKENKNASGIYVIKESRFSGSNFGGSFSVKVIANAKQ